MFCLSLIDHVLPLPPHLLGLPLLDAIKGELGRLFIDKVIANLGLCISVYDIQSVEGGFVPPADGRSTYEVKFRLLLFRPYAGEVLVGKVADSDENGLRVSLGFFNDIYIPKHLLQQPCKRGEDGTWMWIEESGGELPFDVDEEVRFRVFSVKYHPVPVEQAEDGKLYAPMEITGEVCGDGLGLTSWWAEEEEEAEAADGE